jgi:methylmalonyl-CoA/ethylmalonyl-CoA epimerase
MDKINTSKVIKIGIVVSDVEDAARRYGELFNLPKTPEAHIYDPAKDAPPKTFQKYLGKEDFITLKYAVINVEPIYIELVQPLGDKPSPWRTFLDKNGPGVATITFIVDGQYEEHIDMMEKAGYPVIFQQEKGFERYSYFDTQSVLGLCIDLKERKPLEDK